MDDFTTQIIADGGRWAETEILGDQALVKVRASAATLTAINAAAGFVRLPKDLLNDPLSSLSGAQRTALRNKITSFGYTLSELTAAVGDLSAVTLGDVLHFAAQRRLKPRYDAPTDTIVCDGPVQPTRPLDDVNAAVT